jgi:rhodanese-related sulfurtransferase
VQPLVIVALGLAAAGLHHVAGGHLAPHTAPAEVKAVALPHVKRAFDDGAAVFIDARSTEAYQAGHIPGARSLPLYELPDGGHPTLDGLPKTATIIVYCQGVSCDSAERLARRLRRAGYAHARVFTQGWEGWTQSGYPAEQETGA